MRVVQTPSQYLRECREAAGISARKLSLKIAADPAYISTVERRNIVPPSEKLVLIEKHLPGFDALRMCELDVETARAASTAA